MTKVTSFKINLNLSNIGLNLFQKVPTFKDTLAPDQIKSLQLGDNLIYVNRYIYAKLQRISSYTPNNDIIVNKLE